MYLFVRLLCRVFLPRVGLPQGLFGPGIPIGERPSPPPCGWSRVVSLQNPRNEGRQPHMAFPAGFTQLDVRMVIVANLTN